MHELCVLLYRQRMHREHPLAGVDDPPVWRRVVIPAGYALDRVHGVRRGALPGSSDSAPWQPAAAADAGGSAMRNAGNLNILNLMYPYGMREMGIQEARPVLGDLVRDAQRHGIETRLTRNGRPAARIALLADPGNNAVECEKILARYADDPGVMLTDPEREAISVVRAVLARLADEERDAR
jgi:hypothetical protein